MQALADCLETVRRGADLEASLRRYPQYRTQLRALLEVVAVIRPLPEDVAPSPSFRETTKSRILGGGETAPWPRAGAAPSEPL